MEKLTYVPQGGWGLVDDTPEKPGVYTDEMSSCRGLAIVGSNEERGAFCHYDNNEARLLGIEDVMKWISKKTSDIDNERYYIYHSDAAIIDAIKENVESSGVEYTFRDFECTESAGLFLRNGYTFLTTDELNSGEFELCDPPAKWSNPDFPTALNMLVLSPSNWSSGGAVTSIIGETFDVAEIFEQTKNGFLHTER